MNDADKVDFLKKWLGTGAINIFGLAFSGKDTVGKRLAELLDANFLSSGDIVRAARDNSKDERIRSATKLADTGVWAPTEEFKELICPYLYDEKLSGKALILSMVGRWIGEEKPVMDALKKGGHDTKAVILLNISEDEVWQRRSLALDPNSRNIGRADDDEDAKVRGRLNDFKQKTLPVVEVYRDMQILIEVNGEQPRDDVFAELINKLYDFARQEY